MKRFALLSLLLLPACSDVNAPNHATVILQNPRTGEKKVCSAEFWTPGLDASEECARNWQAQGWVRIEQNY